MKKAKVLVSVLLSILTLISAIMLSGCAPQVNIDFKECVSATFSGYNGEGRATIDVDRGYILSLLKDMNSASAAGLASTFTFGTVENNGELSNGDVIKIKIGTNDEALKKAGVSVSNTELEFTVDGLSEYVTSSKQLSDEDIAVIKQDSNDFINQKMDYLISCKNSISQDITGATSTSFFMDFDNFEISNVRFNSAYLVSQKEGTYEYSFESMDNGKSSIYCLFDADVSYKFTSKTGFYTTQDFEGTSNYTFSVHISAPEINSEGFTYAGLTFGDSGTTADYVYENYIASLKEYSNEKIA